MVNNSLEKKEQGVSPTWQVSIYREILQLIFHLLKSVCPVSRHEILQQSRLKLTEGQTQIKLQSMVLMWRTTQVCPTDVFKIYLFLFCCMSALPVYMYPMHGWYLQRSEEGTRVFYGCELPQGGRNPAQVPDFIIFQMFSS